MFNINQTILIFLLFRQIKKTKLLFIYFYSVPDIYISLFYVLHVDVEKKKTAQTSTTVYIQPGNKKKEENNV